MYKQRQEKRKEKSTQRTVRSSKEEVTIIQASYNRRYVYCTKRESIIPYRLLYFDIIVVCTIENNNNNKGRRNRQGGDDDDGDVELSVWFNDLLDQLSKMTNLEQSGWRQYEVLEEAKLFVFFVGYHELNIR